MLLSLPTELIEEIGILIEADDFNALRLTCQSLHLILPIDERWADRLTRTYKLSINNEYIQALRVGNKYIQNGIRLFRILHPQNDTTVYSVKRFNKVKTSEIKFINSGIMVPTLRISTNKGIGDCIAIYRIFFKGIYARVSKYGPYGGHDYSGYHNYIKTIRAGPHFHERVEKKYSSTVQDKRITIEIPYLGDKFFEDYQFVDRIRWRSVTAIIPKPSQCTENKYYNELDFMYKSVYHTSGVTIVKYWLDMDNSVSFSYRDNEIHTLSTPRDYSGNSTMTYTVNKEKKKKIELTFSYTVNGRNIQDHYAYIFGEWFSDLYNDDDQYNNQYDDYSY